MNNSMEHHYSGKIIEKDQNSQNQNLLLVLEDGSSISFFFSPGPSDGIFSLLRDRGLKLYLCIILCLA